MEMSSEKQQAFTVPPRQNPYAQAYTLGFDILASRPLTPEHFCALGVTLQDGAYYVPVLQHIFRVEPDTRDVYRVGGGRVKRAWGVLAIHYLCATDLALDTREVSLSHFDENRGYISVFNKRIINRFLATSGRSAETFIERSDALHGERRPGPGIGYRFNMLPRIPLTLIRHEDDEEFGPDATVIYSADIAGLLPAEDRVVVVELLLDALASKSLDEPEERHGQ
jgi:hypothetical protein